MFDIRQKLILIIDDSVDNRALLTMAFNSKGFSVLCTENGKEALALLAELTYLPDLIFLDAQMPVMDGYQFREEQNKFARLRNIPVVVMSAECSDEMDERMNHPEDILSKPLRLDTVLERAMSCS